MKKWIEFMKRKYVWAAMMAVLLTLTSTYAMLDAFVIPKTYTQVIQSTGMSASAAALNNLISVTENASDTDSQAASADTTDMSYKDANISINVQKRSKDGAVYYVADIQVSSVNYLKTAFANGTFGKNITESTSSIAEENNAIFAINGDYYGFRDTGLIIRNGVLYRDTARASPDNQALTIDSKGNMSIVTEGETSGDSLISSGILQSFSFGPTLVENGKIVSTTGTRVSQGQNPRTAIGQISPLHYIIVVVDGRSSVSTGMTLTQLAQVFVDKGCTVAYNLDGGGSSTMWLNGKVINNPTDGHKVGERNVSDIIYIGK